MRAAPSKRSFPFTISAASCFLTLCVLAVAPATARRQFLRPAPLAFGPPALLLARGGRLDRHAVPISLGSRPRCMLSRSFAQSALSSLTARNDDDTDMGDITSLLSEAPVFTGGNSRMFPVDASTRVAETDIIMGTGIGQSEQLQDAIDQAVAAAIAKWPTNSDGLPTVPSLAVMYFSSEYAAQGLGRVLPCLLRTFATTGGKSWKVGASVIGCSAAGFDLEDTSTPAVSVTLIQGNLLAVNAFCAGDEAAEWSENDWSYKGGLKGLADDSATSIVLLGHPSSEAATAKALQQLHAAYPLSNKVGGIAGGAAGSDVEDRCVIFRKGTGVFNKKGQLIYGEDKNAAKYSSSDDLFFDGGTWRRTGLVGVAISGLALDNICPEASASGPQEALARVSASKALQKEDGLVTVGGLALADNLGSALFAPAGLRKSVQKTLNAPVVVTILEKVLVSRESPQDFSVTVELASNACSLSTLYAADAGGMMKELSDEELEAIQGYEQDTLVNAAGQILQIPKYEGPNQKKFGSSGSPKKKGKRR